jgi:hypothetical protein
MDVKHSCPRLILKLVLHRLSSVLNVQKSIHHLSKSLFGIFQAAKADTIAFVLVSLAALILVSGWLRLVIVLMGEGGGGSPSSLLLAV